MTIEDNIKNGVYSDWSRNKVPPKDTISEQKEKIAKLEAQLEVAKEYFSYITTDSYVADYQSEYFLCVKQAKEALTRIAAMEAKND